MHIICLIRIASRCQNMRSAFKVALVVGTLLNLVNQGGSFLEGMPLNKMQILLNFCVPFCVSSYSIARSELRHRKE